MILVDTSVWIELLGKAKKFSVNSDQLLHLAICPPVLQEILQGIREDRIFRKVKDSLLAFPCLGNPVTTELYLEAASLYRSARRRGITVRSSSDCLIAAIALKTGHTLWHDDRDFDKIAGFTDLKVVSQFN